MTRSRATPRSRPIELGDARAYVPRMSEQVRLSEAAARRVQVIAAKQGNPSLKLRLAVDGGGCAGFQYKFGLETEASADDTIVTTDGVALLVDPVSLPFLEGSEVDFVESLAGKAFQVKNPNATSGCGCGTSFSV